MSESLPASTPRSPDRWKTAALVLTILTTVFASVLAALQTDADLRASAADRDSQSLAVLASGELQRTGLVTNYESSLLAEIIKDLQTGTVLELTALEQNSRGEEKAAETSLLLAAAAKARFEQGRSFSTLYVDPRYAPADDSAFPDLQAYSQDLYTQANEIVAQQNVAADLYHLWSTRADAYVTVLTVLAVAFFLFGLAQTVQALLLQRFFVLSGALILGGTIFWAISILLA
jgi:hypothetical protein